MYTNLTIVEQYGLSVHSWSYFTRVVPGLVAGCGWVFQYKRQCLAATCVLNFRAIISRTVLADCVARHIKDLPAVLILNISGVVECYGVRCWWRNPCPPCQAHMVPALWINAYHTGRWRESWNGILHHYYLVNCNQYNNPHIISLTSFYFAHTIDQTDKIVVCFENHLIISIFSKAMFQRYDLSL